MTWFSLPAYRKDTPPAFVDMDGCNAWLATQPLANAPAMQDALAGQLEALNAWALPARERYKILETLRKPVFAIEAESGKRYDGRPVPLSAVEQKAFDGSCRLWRQLATGYLHCLRACLDKDASLTDHQAKIAHRTLTSLRMEQLARYRGTATVPGHWWRLLHATLASADQLGVSTTAISDRLLPETRESTVAGQYAMAMLLHLSRPHELSRSQFGAVLRWLPRWREQVKIHASANDAGDSRTIVIELSGDEPIHAARGAPANGRWLALDTVLGKFKSRMRDLRAGKSPEELNLGNSLPVDACIGLLQFLHGAVQAPAAPPPSPHDAQAKVRLATTLECIHLLHGGKPIAAQEEPTSLSNRRQAEQIAIFGHVVRENTPSAESGLEDWLLLFDQNGLLALCRPAGTTGERLSNRSLVAIRAADGTQRLAVFRSLLVQEDGSLLAWAKTLPGKAIALTANGRERVTNRIVPHPAIFLSASAQTGTPASLFLPAGAMSKLVRLDVAELPDGLKVGAPLDRGSNYERLACQ